ncbi:hypothetical protein FWG76_00570 [Candidatus Saccharibacteria bacterium]|nr:hypothetical protein [Candidatus Saccharibacteria bacterium]
MFNLNYTGPGVTGNGAAMNDAEASYIVNCIIGAAHGTIGKDEIVVVGTKSDCLAYGVVALPSPLTGAESDRGIIARALEAANTKRMAKIAPGRDLDDGDILDIAKEIIEEFRKKNKTLDGKHIFLLDSSSGNTFCIALRDKPGSGTMRTPTPPAWVPPTTP